MEPMLRLAGYWCDDDLFKLTVYACDSKSCFETEVFTDSTQLKQAAAGLAHFAERVAGDFDLEFGRFGPGFAAGALHARLQFASNGRLNVTLRMQSDYTEFAGRKVASEATLYLTVELGMLDNFVRALRAMGSRGCDEAQLEAEGVF